LTVLTLILVVVAVFGTKGAATVIKIDAIVCATVLAAQKLAIMVIALVDVARILVTAGAAAQQPSD
jgi:hypothetical protein